MCTMALLFPLFFCCSKCSLIRLRRVYISSTLTVGLIGYEVETVDVLSSTLGNAGVVLTRFTHK